jgi:hypothetical protein
MFNLEKVHYLLDEAVSNGCIGTIIIFPLYSDRLEILFHLIVTQFHLIQKSLNFLTLFVHLSGYEFSQFITTIETDGFLC